MESVDIGVYLVKLIKFNLLSFFLNRTDLQMRETIQRRLFSVSI
jgi:hypothetical protein